MDTSGPNKFDIDIEVSSRKRSLKDITSTLGTEPDHENSFSIAEIEPVTGRRHDRTAWRIGMYEQPREALDQAVIELTGRIAPAKDAMSSLRAAGDATYVRIAQYHRSAYGHVCLTPDALAALAACGLELDISCYPVSDE